MKTERQYLQFEETGYLKAGVHNCTWDVLQGLTFTNFHRKTLGDKLLNFLDWPLRIGAFSKVYIGGGFVSNRPYPDDIDLVLETRYPFGPKAFAAIEPFFSKGLDDILEIYSVHLHFWMKDAPSTLLDYRSFFQYQQPQQSNSFDLKKKGIVRLSLLPEDFIDSSESMPDTEPSGQFAKITVGREEPASVAA